MWTLSVKSEIQRASSERVNVIYRAVLKQKANDLPLKQIKLAHSGKCRGCGYPNRMQIDGSPIQMRFCCISELYLVVHNRIPNCGVTWGGCKSNDEELQIHPRSCHYPACRQEPLFTPHVYPQVLVLRKTSDKLYFSLSPSALQTQKLGHAHPQLQWGVQCNQWPAYKRCISPSVSQKRRAISCLVHGCPSRETTLA